MAKGSELVLSADIDPYGYLAKAAGAAPCYTEENAILYFEQQGSNNDDYKFSDSYHEENYHSHTFWHRYTLVKPVIFGVCDIVKVQASFMAVPLKQGKFKSMMVLRGITLVDGTFTHVWKVILSDKWTYQTDSPQQSRVHHLITKPKETKITTLKQKVGYLDEELHICDKNIDESHGNWYTKGKKES